jgi:putative oxidoreductase
VAWTWRGRGKATAEQAAGVGLQIVALASALLLLPHAASAFVRLDVEGMRSWGESMSQAGFPHGVALVWSIKSLELLCCVARLSRRLVVPACLGHLFILVPGMLISQHLAWFDLGPGEGGIEYPVLLSACALATLLAYWPRSSAVTAPLPATAP